MIGNIIHLAMREGSTRWSEPLYQYDYGQRLIIEGIELPSVYEAHFSNEEDGTSKTMIGNETGVDIPDEYLLKSGSIHVWIYLHTGLSDGETEYHGIIQVIPRTKPTNEEPTPVQQDTITQTIAELSSAVEEAEALAESIPDTIQNALQEAKDSGEFDGFSPIATVEKVGDTATITITDVNGTTTAEVKDAFVPTASVEKVGDTATITITDVNGTTSATVKDAFVPTASVEKEGKVSTISITDVNGHTEATVEDGVTFTPSIDQNGILSWSNDGGRPNPEDVPLAVHPENYATKDEINGKLDASEKGAPNGVAMLDSKGALLIEQLPSYVNDVLEYRNVFIFPNPGETGKIYVATNTNRLYRWTGRAYEELQADRIAATESDVGKVLSPRTVINGKVDEWQFITGGGGSGGTSDYEDLDNKPKINNVELSGNKSLHQLGIAAESDIPDVSGFYTKPASGIPASDLEAGVIPDVSGKMDEPVVAGSNEQVLVSNGSGGQTWQDPKYIEVVKLI